MPANPDKELEQICRYPPRFVLHDRYRFADATLDVFSEDLSFGRRLYQIFGECLATTEDKGPFVGTCQVRLSEGEEIVAVLFGDDHPLDTVRFTLSLFPDGRYREVGGNRSGWRFLARVAEDHPFAAFHKDAIVIDRSFGWEAFVGHYMLHRMLRLQPDIMFFHAASVTINGAGVLLAGPEKSGKTTLSMALASQGAIFLGDDLAAVRRPSANRSAYELIPFRRAVSMRRGARAGLVDAQISAGSYREEVYLDGDIRIRAPAGDFFCARPVAAPLEYIFFLHDFEPGVRVNRASPGLNLVQLLTPLASTFWGVPPGALMMDFFRLLRRIQCFFLHPGGSVEETALAVEQTVREHGVNNPRESSIHRNISGNPGFSDGDAGAMDANHPGA